jgi:hypothetical protein
MKIAFICQEYINHKMLVLRDMYCVYSCLQAGLYVKKYKGKFQLCHGIFSPLKHKYLKEDIIQICFVFFNTFFIGTRNG